MKLPNYTQISNAFIESMDKYSGSAVKIFIAISRKTIGWHKQSDRISYSQLREITGLSINSMKSAIKELIKDKWIKQNSGKNGYSYDLAISEIDIGVSKSDTVTISKNDTTKETSKETNTKEIYGKFKSPTPEQIQQYLNEKNITSFSGIKFYNYYAARGWMLGKSGMKNWKAAVSTWQINQKDFEPEKKVDKNESKLKELNRQKTVYTAMLKETKNEEQRKEYEGILNGIEKSIGGLK